MNKRTLVWIVVAILFAAAAWWLVRPHPPAGAGAHGGMPQGPVPVPVVDAQPRTIPVRREYVARTESSQRVEIRARATGYLIERSFKEGDDVTEGQVLFRIDSRDYTAQRDRAAAAADLATRQASRAQVLARTGAGAVSTLDERASQQRQSEADLRAANVELGFTVIRAPFAGRIGRAEIEQGNLITAANTLLTTLVRLDPLRATFSPSELDLTAIRDAAAQRPVPAEFLPAGAEDRPLAGKLDFIGNEVDAATGTILMRAELSNTDRHALPGQFGRIRLTLAERQNTILVPQTALGTDQVGRYVFIAGTDGTLQRRDVVLGDVLDREIVVEKGLAVGDKVVVMGLQKMRAGMPVKPVPVAEMMKPPAPPAAAAPAK